MDPLDNPEIAAEMARFEASLSILPANSPSRLYPREAFAECCSGGDGSNTLRRMARRVRERAQQIVARIEAGEDSESLALEASEMIALTAFLKDTGRDNVVVDVLEVVTAAMRRREAARQRCAAE